MQSDTAVASMTLSPCSSTWRYDIRSNREARGWSHRVGVINAVDLGGFEDHVGLDFHRPERSSRVGAEVRISGPGAKQDHTSLLEVPDGSAPNERFSHGPHLDGSYDASIDVYAARAHPEGPAR